MPDQRAMMSNSKLVGGAGEHYVAYVLSCFGYICALVREGAPTVDLLASSIDGSKAISIQVKTSKHALRKRGRGDNKKPHHLEFTLGRQAVKNAQESFIFCFVDLHGLKDPLKVPDVYVIPSEVIRDHYEEKDLDSIKWLRLHWGVEKMEFFKNNWEPIIERLSGEVE